MEQETLDQIQDLLHNEKWMTARALRFLAVQSGLDVEPIALGITLITAIFLLASSSAQLIANGILVVVPLLLTFVYSDERPSSNLLFIYWSLFGILTTLDLSLENTIPAYYLLKVLLLAMLFLKPFNYAQKIVNFLQESNVKLEDEKQSRRGSKEDVEKPKSPAQTEKSDRKLGKRSAPAESKDQPTENADRKPAKRTSSAESNNQPTEATQASVSTVTKRSENGSAARDFSGPNPMITDSNYRVGSDFVSGDELSGRDMKGVGPAANLNDFLTSPTEKIIFNGPFDHSVVYHVKIQNNSKHHMAYCTKSNCIPRITAFPPSAILKPGQKMVIGIKCEPFNPDETRTDHDRVSFEYVFCDAKETVFAHRLLQAPYRRRKNMRVSYNP